MKPSIRSLLGISVPCPLLALNPGCKTAEKKTANVPPENAPASTEKAAASPEAAAERPAAITDPAMLERLNKEHWKGDLEGMVERRFIRALVLYNKTNFFYDGPQGRGVNYEALQEFQKFLNQKLGTGEKPVYIVYVPVRHAEMEQRLTDGRGDIAASNLPVLEELKDKADFSNPVRADAKQLVVTGPSAPAIASLDDLAGKEIYVRKTSRYWISLNKLSDKLAAAGKPKVIFKPADENLEDEDILNLVNTGVIGITVIDDLMAGLWSQVYTDLKVHSDIPVQTGDQIAWVVPKNTPNLLAAVNEFIETHKVGTAYGNTLLKRYFKDTKFTTNNTAPTEMQKYSPLVVHFKKYAPEGNFDWLMIAAQAYQESQMDQSRRSSAGAVGVMQIKPSTAAGNPININDVETNAENNIHAAVKYLNFMMTQYFEKEPLDRVNRGLFAAASYNAGPARVAKLRAQAKAEGLDPNRWFNNVELIAAKEIGAETVTYVSNIYKYYIAYKLATERTAERKTARTKA